MSLLMYRLDFAGGPQDGLRGYCGHIPDTRLLFPLGRGSSPLGSEPGGPKIVAYSFIADSSASVYKYEQTVTAGKTPHLMLVLHYRFDGFLAPARHHSAEVTVTRRSQLDKCLAAAARNLVGRLRNWLLTPTTYPLQISFPTMEQRTSSRR